MANKSAIDATLREQALATLQREQFDVLVIGAGITGCGVARDAAMRGMRVAVVDAKDIGAATSSRSAKLIHGGVRYLAQGQMNVVKEAANERRTIRKLAPHLSITSNMVVVVRKKTHLTALRAGLTLYEKLGNVDESERHVIWDYDELKSNEPSVNMDGLIGAAVYPEYQTEDSRLTLANARSAAAHEATIVTYAAVDDILIQNGKAVGALVRNTLSEKEKPFEVRAKVIVNAAGIWVDAVRKMEEKGAKNKLQLTKGIHLVFSRDRLPIDGSICWSAPDKRGLFTVPRGRFVYAGTTDTFYPEPDYWPEITREDIDYLKDSANTIFNVDSLTDADIIGLWSGVRPLLGEEGKKPSEISRRHELLTGPGGMITVAGGKLTAYRSMAQRVADQCQKILGAKPNPAATDVGSLPGGDFSEPFEQFKTHVEALGIPPIEAERLARLYGSEALTLFSEKTGPAVEAEFAVRTEGALTLEDYWVRRSARSNFDHDGGMDALEPAAEIMGNLLNWSDAEKNSQIESCQKRRQKEMSILDT
ncbi:MAG: glycerol-3-phosphate dehydrogenase/oxidase [Deltaproteobacteria bacterium]|nr:glycerol-3-phosphate dehydrogenase/oxidase [Deltaproteobacteria bacterium]